MGFKHLRIHRYHLRQVLIKRESIAQRVEPVTGTFGTCPWEIDEAGVLHVKAGTLTLTEEQKNNDTGGPWEDASHQHPIKSIKFDSGVKGKGDLSFLFDNLNKKQKLDMCRLSQGWLVHEME